MRSSKLKWLKIGFDIIAIILTIFLIIIGVLRLSKIYFLLPQPDSNNFYECETYSALWGILITICFNYMIGLAKRTKIIKNYFWWIRINSLSKKIGYDLDYKIYRHFFIEPQYSPVSFGMFKEYIRQSISDLNVKETIISEWKNNVFTAKFLLNSKNIATFKCVPSVFDREETQYVDAFRLYIATSDLFKKIDVAILESDFLLYIIAQNIGHLLKDRKLKWETPILEVSPLKHFIKDSYWLNQLAENSVITVQLKDGVIVTLTKERVEMKYSKVEKPENVFIDKKLTFHLQQAIASFYEGTIE